MTPDAERVVRAELAALRDPEVPADVSASWMAALRSEAPQSEALPPEPPFALANARPGRRYRLMAAAALLVAVVTGTTLWAALDEPAPRPTFDLLGAATGSIGRPDAGPLADPMRRAGCLRALGERVPDAPLVGARGVVVAGEPGILLVLAAGRPGVFRVVVVDPRCGPSGGTMIANGDVGG